MITKPLTLFPWVIWVCFLGPLLRPSFSPVAFSEVTQATLALVGCWNSHLLGGAGAGYWGKGDSGDFPSFQPTMPRGAALGLRGALPAALLGGTEGLQRARSCC